MKSDLLGDKAFQTLMSPHSYQLSRIVTAAHSEDGETSRKHSMHTHPSGVELVDPPEGVPVFFEDPQEQPLSNQRSSLLQLSFSRKSSKKLGSALQRARQGPSYHLQTLHAL